MKSLLLGVVLLAAGCTQTVKVGTAAPPPERTDPPSDPLGPALLEFSRSHHRAALRLLENPADFVNTDARASYLAGYVQLRLHRPDLAKPLLTQAAARGFNGYPAWESTSALLDRIAVIEQLRPPNRSREGLRVFADDTPWMRAVLKELPEFVSRVRTVFGPELPPIDFYLFQSRDDYNRFYKALFGVEVSSWWQNGTGDSNVVVFCQEDRQRKPLGPPGAARGLGDVLHEYSHALLNTLYGDGYLRTVPQWLDEGVSDFVARPYYGELFETSAVAIRKSLARSAPPGDQDLARRIYERDSFLRYAFARYMVEEMMKGRATAAILDVLKRAGPEGDFDAAILATTGISAGELRERVVARFR